MCATQESVDDLGQQRESSLCLSCGICCRGVIYADALLDAEELNHAIELQMVVYKKSDDQDVFKLPCAFHDGQANACSIYEERFHVCSRYKCDLLNRVSEKTTELDTAKEIVQITRTIESSLYQILGPRESSQSIWTQIDHYLEMTQDSGEEDARRAELLLHGRLLALMCQRHFDHRMRPDLRGRWRIRST